ncbi:MAG: pcrA-B [Chlamydiales bacterium]|jgi:DNA helicase-2/ATP-dependent DNA helicase PcrA|nr:pcrA-B [Chlamydiales bacterium]
MELSSLNTEQQVAATHVEGPLLVLAGAGSGKTRIVTHRIIYLLEMGVPASRILGVTFTNKAAAEMRERVKSMTSQQVFISTFHSLGARILRESIQALGYQNNFIIYDEEDCQKVIGGALKSLGVNDKELTPKIFKQLISNAKGQLLHAENLEPEGNSKRDKLLPEIYRLYQSKLKEANALDFDDLLFLTVRLFKEHPKIAEYYQSKWSFVLIDEYQDTNFAQYLIVRTLVEKSKNLFVVGDPDQSIYSWRGADINNILNFEQDYPGAKVVMLEQNYRSTSTILNAANAVIKLNQQRYEKNLWSTKGQGEKIYFHQAESDQLEARFVAEKIAYHKRQGISLNEMVIFYRTNFQSRTFEDALLQSDIPYVVVGGISFYQRREIKDILAYLRIAQGCNDLVSFARTVNIPKRGLGDVFIEKMMLASQQLQLSIFNVSLAIVNNDPVITNIGLKVSAKQKEALKEYTDAIVTVRLAAERDSLKAAVEAAIKQTRYLVYLKEDPETYDDRKENLNELISKAAEWEAATENPSLTAFLEDLTLKTNLEEGEVELERVSLMTIHNGKGLEFKVAFLVGMEEELFPHVNSRNSISELEEERRLCYVGMTRAKEVLYFSTAQFRYLWGNLRTMRPSRFLKEVPKEYMQKTRSSYSYDDFDENDDEERDRNKYSRFSYSDNKEYGSDIYSPPASIKSKPVAVNIIEDYKVGDRVFHATFGEGAIQEITSGALGEMYKILFDKDKSLRTLVAKYANLIKRHKR